MRRDQKKTHSCKEPQPCQQKQQEPREQPRQ